MALEPTLLTLLDEIRAIALNGLLYSPHNSYDIDRYTRLLHLAAQHYSPIVDLPAGVVLETFRRDMGAITPKVGGNGAIFDDEGRVLLVKRSDNGRWCLPGGYAEVGLTAQENVTREVREETGLEVEVGKLVDLFCVQPSGISPHLHYVFVYLCQVTGGTLAPSHETPELGYFDPAQITDWHSTHQERVQRALAMWRASR
jgi:ADP-ribose pyrophosphatase YjhB (NUDIX family)